MWLHGFGEVLGFNLNSRAVDKCDSKVLRFDSDGRRLKIDDERCKVQK